MQYALKITITKLKIPISDVVIAANFSQYYISLRQTSDDGFETAQLLNSENTDDEVFVYGMKKMTPVPNYNLQARIYFPD